MQHTRRNFVKTLFAASQAALVAGVAVEPAEGEETAVSSGGFNYLVVGDWGRDGERDQVEVAGQMSIAATDVNARLVISVGDNFYEDGVAAADDPQWQSSFEEVYQAESLQIPWYVILGNHDYHGNPEAELAYAKASKRWRMPARYYTESHRIDAETTVEFFYIDTSPMVMEYRLVEKMAPKVMAEDVPKQLAWLDEALGKSTAEWKIVVGHHPVYSGGEHGDQPEVIAQVLPLLHKHQVPVYLNGHDHDLQHLQAGGVNFFTSGAGSQFRRTTSKAQTKFARATSGFMTVSMRREEMAVRMIDNHGTVLYQTTVQRVVG